MNRVRQGFALPTVLIASLVMMMVLMTGLTATSGTKTNLDEQYYVKLAEEAAEAGAVFAQNCMQSNGFVAPWAGKTLASGKACNGTTNVSAEQYLVSTGDLRTRWEVANIPASTNQQFIDVTGYTELIRQSSGATWKTYTKHLRVKVSSEIGATKVAFGYGSTTGSSYGVFFGTITSSGAVKTLGYNGYGQLGNGNTTNATTPQNFQLPADVTIRDLYASFLSTGQAMHAVTTQGRLYSTGRNDYGQLGLGHTNSVNTPQLVTTNISNESVAMVDNNSWVTYVLTRSGKVYSAGNCVDSSGALGIGTCPSNYVNTYRQVSLPSGAVAAEIVTDNKTAFVRTTDGRVYGWGLNLNGALGPTPTPSSTAYTATPVQVASTVFRNIAGQRAKKMAFDGLTLYVIRDDGSLWGLGYNEFKQIVNTSQIQYTAPQQMNTVTYCNTAVKDVKTDRSHVAVLFENGTVCTAGWNGTLAASGGLVGRGLTPNDANKAQPLARVTGVNTYGIPSTVKGVSIAVNSIFGGQSQRANNTFIVGDNGKVYGAGSNFYGQLGDGTTTPSSTFVEMQVFGASEPAKEVQSGYGTTVIFTGTGRVYAVGNNSHGQIGDGTTTNRTTPVASNYLNVGPPTYF